MTPSAESSLTPLEQAVLRAICDKHPADQAALEAQLATVTVLRRENTGAGFYTYLSVDQNSTAALSGDRLRHGPAVKVDGLKNGMGFILWLKQGYTDHLEGFSYDESTTNIAFDTVLFEVLAK